MRSIRAGMGLGDSLYLQSIVRHLVERGERLRVHSAWPDVFRPLTGKVEVVPFSRQGINLLAHYTLRKSVPGTTQFQDMCISAHVAGPVDLRLDWTIGNPGLVQRLRADGRPIVCVQLPRAPMGRSDGFGNELLPDCRRIQQVIDRLKERALIVQIGSGVPMHRFTGLDIDLAGSTTVAELLDVASIADGFVGYCSFLVPLAESFSKPALLVWSRKGLKSREAFIRQVTPQKVLHRSTSTYVVDDWPTEQIDEAASAFLR